jgi:WD40 repeat protein
MLAIVHGSTVTTWQQKNGEAAATVNRLVIPQYGADDDDNDASVITDLCWNHNGQVLATCADTTKQQQPSVVLVNTSAYSTGTVMDAFPHEDGTTSSSSSSSSSRTVPTSLSFGGKSRYLCIANDTGHVGLWDLKQKLRVRSYSPSPLTPSLQTAMDDTYCYSLTKDALHVLNIKQGTVAASIGAIGMESSNRFTRMQLLLLPSNSKSHSIAIGTQNGDIEIHRISSATGGAWLLTKLTTSLPHQGAIQGMDVLNEQVLASCSADGILCFTHIEQETTIQSIQLTDNNNTPMNLTSLSVEGNLCAVGTDTGTVHIYNVRNFDAPLAILELEDVITTLKFATTASSIKPSSKVLATPPRPNSSKLTSAPVSPIRQTVDELSDMVQDVLLASPKKRQGLQHPPSIPEGDEYENIEAQVSAPSASTVELVDHATATLTSSMDALRDDVTGCVRNMHVDMIRQFQAQNDHLAAQLTKQSLLFGQILTENQMLRRENERLKTAAANSSNRAGGGGAKGKKVEGRRNSEV